MEKKPRPLASKSSQILSVGTAAPDFTLPADENKSISLSDYRGRNVLLIFYPADWSTVCGSELTLFTEIYSEFKDHNTELLGISVDNFWSHRAYVQDMNIPFPLLADFEPKGKVSKMYGAYDDHYGFSSRALFLIDGRGVIRWSYLSPLFETPAMDEVLEQVEAMHV